MNARIWAKVGYGLLAGSLMVYAFLFWEDRVLISKGYPDFTIFYSAGLIVRQGHGHHLYDPAEQHKAQLTFASGVEIRKGALPFNHPPFEALIFLPLTFLPYPAAYLFWDGLNLLLLVLVVRLLRPCFPFLREKSTAFWIAVLLAFFPVAFCFLQGQDVILLLLLQSMAFVALKKNSNFAAGFCFGLGDFKFQLIVPLVLVIALGWKRMRVLYGFLAGSLCVILLSILTVGWNQLLHYPIYALQRERLMERGTIMPSSMPNLRGLIEGWQPSTMSTDFLHSLTLLVSAVLLLWAILCSRRYRKQEMNLLFALAATVGILVSYHALTYDLTLLVIPIFSAVQVMFDRRKRWQQGLTLFLPILPLLFTPAYALLGFREMHVHLLAVLLLLWLVAITYGLKSAKFNPAVEPSVELGQKL